MTEPENLPSWPTTASIEKALGEAMDIERLTDSERINVIRLILETFRNGHHRGAETISAAWRKSNADLFSKAE